MSDYKWVIGDENGDPIGVSEEEAIKWLWDSSEEGLRKKSLYHSKSLKKGVELFKEVLEDYEWSKFEIKTGRGLGI